MAKKTSSIHIENKLWDYIADYQLKNGIDSRNTAIEWILVEHRNNRSASREKNIENITNHNETNNKKIEIEPKESDAMSD